MAGIFAEILFDLKITSIESKVFVNTHLAGDGIVMVRGILLCLLL